MHRVAFTATADERRHLEELGIRPSSVTAMPGDGDPFIAFDIGEDDPKWPHLQVLLRKWGHSDGHVTTEFSKEEIDSARWIEIGAWHIGFPQPEDDSGYLRATYDLTEWCDACGIGLKQRAPFQMKGEPKWGRRTILQLNWVFDELFVTPEVWSGVFKPHGIVCRPVTTTKGAELKRVVQLVLEEEVGIVTDELTPEQCAKCGRVKYLPVTRGFFPALTSKPTGAMVKTREHFGSGGAADKRVLVSQDLARALVAAKVRGASFWPVQSANGDP